MWIFQRFSRIFIENSTPPKAMNAFTICGGNLLSYPQAKSDDGIVNGTVDPVCNTIRNVAVQQGSYLSVFLKNPLGPLCFRGEGHLSFDARSNVEIYENCSALKLG